MFEQILTFSIYLCYNKLYGGLHQGYTMINKTQSQPSKSLKYSEEPQTQKKAIVTECGKCQDEDRPRVLSMSAEVHLSQPLEAGKVLKERHWDQTGHLCWSGVRRGCSVAQRRVYQRTVTQGLWLLGFVVGINTVGRERRGESREKGV